MEIVNVPLDKINEPDDPSRIKITHEPMQQLIDSIRDKGLLQPISLKRCGDRFEVEFGHRRFLAMKQLGWNTAPSIILGNTDKDDPHIERAHENLIRENLSVIEEAKMVNTLVNESDRGIEEVERLIKRSAYWIESRLALLDYPDELIAALTTEEITLAVAKELSKCKDADYRMKLLEYVIDTGATAKVVGRWVSDASLEDLTKALDQAKETGHVQSLDLGPINMGCGICIEAFAMQQLRHVWLCPTCLDGIAKIKQDIINEAAQETATEAMTDNETPG